LRDAFIVAITYALLVEDLDINKLAPQSPRRGGRQQFLRIAEQTDFMPHVGNHVADQVTNHLIIIHNPDCCHDSS
jgi:hypothetical protein